MNYTYFLIILQMFKTTRNILIANMAVSDLLLCLFTMPLTMLDLIHNYWPLGENQVYCTEHSLHRINRLTGSCSISLFHYRLSFFIHAEVAVN